jgi:fatty acid desaturase
MPTTYDQAARGLRATLKAAVPRDTLRALHRVSGARHAAVLAQQVLLLAAAVFAVLRWGGHPWVWIPAAVVIGLVVFGFTVLLHEVVHGAVFARPRPRWSRLLGHLYAVPSGLSASQFTRWHLDHHRWLGTAEEDPKRRYLTPKRVRRWFKALYLTPALFPIYFRAARRAGAAYPDALRRRIRRERRASILFHAGTLAALWFVAGPGLAVKLHAVPVFLVFPVAFTINRLGQHYDVDPEDPARWGTLLRPSPLLWDRLFLWSNYHLEHHYFPRVPCYRLPALRRALDPFFAARRVPARTYGGLLWDWFVGNRVPHTDWSLPAGAGRTGAAEAP